MPRSKSAKKELLEFAEHLPNTATWDDIMYAIYVRKKLDSGLAAIERGEVVSHDEVKRRFLSQK